jgi:iron(III) transport system ATP-binding protein
MSDRRTHVRAEHRHIGYVAQEGALFPHLRVAENITFGLRAAGRRARERVGAMLALVGLPDAYADRWPQELSGGEQQRVALARALAPGPRLVLLDEPFSSLDAALRSETRDAVAAALREAGATAILVTHDQSEALSMGQQVAVLRGGRLVQTASPEVLYRQPADAELARFVGEAVTMPGVAAHGVGRCRLGALRLISPVPDGPVDIMIRPEQLRLVPTPETADQSATVVEVVFFGPDAKVTLAVADGASLTARVAGHRAPAIGTRVGIRIEGGVIAFARASG